MFFSEMLPHLILFVLWQPGTTADMEEEDVYNEIPSDWWLSPDSKGRLLCVAWCTERIKKLHLFALVTGTVRTERLREGRRKVGFRRRGPTTGRNA